MIRLEHVQFSYRRDAPLYQDFSWSIDTAQHWTILGPSGCGKTTLLKLIAGLLHPGAGQVCVHNAPITRPRPSTGLILQNYGLLPWSNVWHNVALGWKIRHFYGQDGVHTPQDTPIPSRAERREIVDYWVDRLGLWKVRRQFPAQLSGGQQQRVAISRTLALKPDLLLMDEPFNSLDAVTREGLQDLVIQLRAEFNMTTVIVTHAVDEAAVLGSRILALDDPPNHAPTLIHNPASEDADYRAQPAYLEMRNRLRAQMGLQAS
jgi:ABC-type nitrate/sulfonate/bicarbonate transport system ATPase subunit